MDVLSDVLRVVRLSGAVFFAAEFSSPWALESPNPDLLASVVMPKADCLVLFHVLMEGRCFVECAGIPPVEMRAGDVVIFPHGESHTMRSHKGVKATPIGSVITQDSFAGLRQVAFGGGGEKSRFICGYLNCDQRFNPLTAALPTMLFVRSSNEYGAVEAIDRNGLRPARVSGGSGTWLGTTLKFTISEAKAAQPGNTAMLGRLTELMFVEILRQYMQQLPADQGGWLAGLNDVYVGKALRLIHANPQRNWTVGELAREAATSRSVLAQRFTGLVGESPMKYLAGWRIQVAKQMLREGANIGEVSTRVGYESEAAFNRAFKRTTGTPPASWRRHILAVATSLASFLIPADDWLANLFLS